MLSAFSDYTRFLQELAGRDTSTAQDTYLSNCRKKDKAREERKRIEKEQAYIDAGSWDDWDAEKEVTRLMLPRREKEEIDRSFSVFLRQVEWSRGFLQHLNPGTR